MKSPRLYFLFSKFWIVFLFSTFYFLISGSAWAAVLSIKPAENQYHPADILVAEVKLDTEREVINAVYVRLSFSAETLEFKEFSKGNSVLTLWAEEPDIDNQNGALAFSAGIPGGYNGSDGLLGKIIFEAKKDGRAEVSFEDDSEVLLNDGLGSKARLETRAAVFNVLPPPAEFLRDEWQGEIIRDTIPPEPFKIEIHQDPLLFEGQYFITFLTTDKQTGLDRYEIQEGRGGWTRAQSPYLLKNQRLTGKIKVKAVDKAGNERIAEYVPPIRPRLFLWGVIIIIVAILVIIGWMVRKFLINPEGSNN